MQGIQTVKDTICGLQVETTQFLPMRAHKLLAKLAKVMGPALAEIGNVELDDEGDVVDFDIGNLGPAIVRVFGELDDVTAERLPLEILAGTSVVRTVDGQTQRFDIMNVDAYNNAFAGVGAAPYMVMAFALKVNYARFLEDLAAFGPKRQAKEKALPSSGEST